MVTAVITGEGRKHLVEVAVTTKSGSGKVAATGEHPFWGDDQGRWLDVKDLKPGHRLRSADGDQATVTNTRPWTETRKVHNLTIDGIHTYYVEAGTTPVLTHDSNCAEPWLDLAGETRIRKSLP